MGAVALAELRLGILGCDTSHVVEFTKRLNGIGIAAEQWVPGARVVSAWPGTSEITSAEQCAAYVQALQGFGVEIVERPEDLVVDAVLIEAQEGATHAALAVPLLRAGVPVFVDKPFACSVTDAALMVEAAARGHAPLLSASSLRFAREVTGLAVGQVLGAEAHSPASLHPRNPGLFHYGIHAVEMLYALMGGPGCRTIAALGSDGADAVTGLWADGRIGSVRGLRAGARGYGFVAFGQEATAACAAIDTGWIYHELLKVVVAVLSGAPSPVSAVELVEAVAFGEMALRSAGAGGAPVRVPVI